MITRARPKTKNNPLPLINDKISIQFILLIKMKYTKNIKTHRRLTQTKQDFTFILLRTTAQTYF